MTKEQAIKFLERDGNLAVPGGRYGTDTESCAPVAYEIAQILAEQTGEELTEESLDYAMGLVVNSHDDVAYLLDNYSESIKTVEQLAQAVAEQRGGVVVEYDDYYAIQDS